jgi:hypothetical protein
MNNWSYVHSLKTLIFICTVLLDLKWITKDKIENFWQFQFSFKTFNSYNKSRLVLEPFSTILWYCLKIYMNVSPCLRSKLNYEGYKWIFLAALTQFLTHEISLGLKRTLIYYCNNTVIKISDILRLIWGICSRCATWAQLYFKWIVEMSTIGWCLPERQFHVSSSQLSCQSFVLSGEDWTKFEFVLAWRNSFACDGLTWRANWEAIEMMGRFLDGRFRPLHPSHLRRYFPPHSLECFSVRLLFCYPALVLIS